MLDDKIKPALEEIRELEAQLEQKKKAIRQEGIAKAQELIDTLGIEASELRFKQGEEKPARKAIGTVAPKYRGPNGETWTGRGRTPRWLAALLEAGHKLEDFKI